MGRCCGQCASHLPQRTHCVANAGSLRRLTTCQYSLRPADLPSVYIWFQQRKAEGMSTPFGQGMQ